MKCVDQLLDGRSSTESRDRDFTILRSSGLLQPEEVKSEFCSYLIQKDMRSCYLQGIKPASWHLAPDGPAGTRRQYLRQREDMSCFVRNGEGRVGRTLDDLIEERGFDREEIHREALRLIAECRAYELQEARKAEHLTQTDVAERMGISQARVSEVESGDIGSLKVSTLMRYAEALGGTFEALIQIGDKTIRLA